MCPTFFNEFKFAKLISHPNKLVFVFKDTLKAVSFGNTSISLAYLCNEGLNMK